MPLPYTTVDRVKTDLGITTSDKDDLLWKLTDAANWYVESVTQRAIGSSSVTNEIIDGWAPHIQDGGYVIDYPNGIRVIDTLEIKLTTDGDYATVPSSDYFIEPREPYRTPGWPGFYIALTDIPATTNDRTSIQGAFGAVRLSAPSTGWAEMPGDIRQIADIAVSRLFHARQAGYSDEVGTDEFGEVSVSRVLSRGEKAILQRYKHYAIEVID